MRTNWPAMMRTMAAVALAAVIAACGSGVSRPSPGPGGSQQADERGLLPVVLPNLTAVDPAARTRIEERYATLTAALREGRPAAERARAFGELGMLLHAAEFHDAAAPCLANAVTLSPAEPRWAYYLAHVHKRRGALDLAAASFERTLRLEPDNLSAAWWLGSTYLEQGRDQDADVQFAKARSADEFAVAALYGLGRSALARRQYDAAAGYLEQVLALDKEAAAAHYPLGLAYRGLGRVADAQVHLRQRSQAEILPPDPLIDALSELVETADAHYGLGIEAGRVGDWVEAVTQFRRALALDPRHAAAALNLSAALHRQGDEPGALAEARKALAINPTEVRAHYIIATIHALGGRDDDAIRAYEEATRGDGRFIEAHLSLAQALRRRGRLAEALARYDVVLGLEPAEAEAQFGSAVTLVRLRRYREARDLLAQGATAHPGEARFNHALARVLAASPSPDVRDGRRALALMEQLMAAEPTIDRARTMAMALAEVGRFDEAVSWQRRAMTAAAEQGNGAAESARLAADLRGYQRKQPVRTPWADDDPIFHPPPQDAPIPN